MTSGSPPNIVQVTAASEYSSLLQEFPSPTAPGPATAGTDVGVCHHIVITGPPVLARAQMLPAKRLRLAKEEFGDFLKKGMVSLSSSSWSSSLHTPGE